jgi:DinB superfamily
MSFQPFPVTRSKQRSEWSGRLPHSQSETLPSTAIPTQLAREFRSQIGEIRAALIALPPACADARFRRDGWTGREILGHLLDSASNNRHRFVLATIQGTYAGPKYAQDDWVAVHRYAHQPWETLLDWWLAQHELLAALVDAIPEDRLQASCMIGEDGPVTLRFLIEDYISHQRHHLAQLRAAS